MYTFNLNGVRFSFRRLRVRTVKINILFFPLDKGFYSFLFDVAVSHKTLDILQIVPKRKRGNVVTALFRPVSLEKLEQ